MPAEVRKIFAIDFETASGRDAVCAVGIYEVGNESNHGTYFLVDPEIDPEDWDPMAMMIHGISPEDVKGAPNFPSIWSLITEIVGDSILLAHNAGFDMSVLRHSFTRYEILPSEITYLCSAKIAKKVWPTIPTTRLDYVSEMLEIEFEHHDPEQDAMASAIIFQKAVNAHYGSTPINFDLSGFISEIGIQFGRIMPNLSYKPCGVPGHLHSAALSKKTIDYEPDPNRVIDEGNPLFGKFVAFTGTLTSMNRTEAFMRLIDLGSEPESSVTKKTNFLVAGEQDLWKFRPGSEVSSKMQKAIDLSGKGQDIEIIGESDFLKLLLS
jgi:DNA polymerase-3 subunit epsilon